MPRLSLTFDMKPLQTHMKGVPRLVRAHCRRRLRYWGGYLIKDIRKHSSVFKYKEGGATGRLLASMWTKRGKGRDPIQHIGWGVAHGEIMEFGPRRAKKWKIRPKGFRSDITEGNVVGKALKMLRFLWHGKITYAKEVTHVWDKGQLRPHVKPALDRHRRGFEQDMGSIVKRVIEGKLT